MAFCTNCGTATTDGQRFCGVCGRSVQGDGLGAMAPMPAWQDPQGDPTGAARVLVVLNATPPRQRRLTVVFRIVLIIPLVLWLGLLTYALELCTFAGWFAAVFTGRVPDGIQNFSSEVLGYNLRVNAYWFLVDARWPGFSLAPRTTDEAFLVIDHVRLNRAAVFFRLILMVPAAIVNAVVSFGTYPFLLAAWLSGIFLGRLPRSLHLAIGQILRFQMKVAAYIALLTPSQPFAEFMGAPSTLEVPGSEVGAAETSPTPRWTLTRAAKTIVVVILVVGTLGLGSYFIYVPRLNAGILAGFFERPVLSTVNTQVRTAVAGESYALDSCRVSPHNTCAEQARLEAQALAAQVSSLQAFETSALKGRRQYLAYVDDISSIVATLSAIESATTTAQQQSLALRYDHQVATLASLYRAAYNAA